MDLYGIAPYLERAKELILSGEEHSLRYACLELRFCLELVAYRQLKQYGEVIPGNIIGIWKADQIIKLLASFDPLSDAQGEISVGIPNASGELPDQWISIGNTRPISWRKFRTFYNKLGSYLHAPESKQEGVEGKPLKRKSLADIVSSLEIVAQSTIILATKNIIHAQCECGNILYVGESEFNDDNPVQCGNTKCNSLFIKQTAESGEKVLSPMQAIIFKCICEAKIPVVPERVWAPIRCPNCQITYRINLAFSSTEIID